MGWPTLCSLGVLLPCFCVLFLCFVFVFLCLVMFVFLSCFCLCVFVVSLLFCFYDIEYLFLTKFEFRHAYFKS